MDNKNLITKIAPIIIALLLVLAVFAVRAETINLGGITDPDMKALYQDESGMPYFTELDSYYNYRLTENYLSTGHLGDTQVNGTDWDSLSTSPNGREANYQPVIIMLAAWVYNFVNIFGNVSLTQVAFWLGPIIGSLAVLPAFYIVRRATGSTWGAIVAGLIAGAAPAYFTHTYGGFFDTDMFNVLFPLMTVLFLTESIYAKKTTFKAIFAALSAIFLALFSLSWSGYAYMVILTFGTLILYFPASYLMDKFDGKDLSNKKEWLKNNPATITFVVFAIIAIILLLITVGSTFVENTFSILGMSTSLQSATAGSAYPNVYVSVGEMQIPQIIDIINNSGGLFTILFALMGFVLMFHGLRKKAKTEEPEKVNEKQEETKQLKTRRYIPKTKKAEEIAHAHEHRFIPGKFEWTQSEKYNNLFLFVLLVLWTLGIALMLTQGTRFIEQFEVPIALMAGISIGIFLKYIDLKIEQKSYVTFIALILVLLAVVSPIYADHLTSSQAVGSTNDDMYNTLTWIKSNTPENSVLASWWDFGHLFTAVADRQVVFDGGSQNNMRAYWIGNSLATSNEDLSAGILRMLANSGEDASNVLDSYTGNTSKTVVILNEILPMDRTQASTTLTGTYGLDQQQANSVLDLTHPAETKPVYLILSSDMLSKAAWWSYFGSWNFENQTSYHYSYYPAQSQSEQVSGKQFTLGTENGVVGVSGTSNETNGSTMNFAYIDQSKLNKTIDMFTAEDKERLANELSEGTGNELLKPHKLIIVENNQLSVRIVNNNSNMSIMAFHQSDNSYFTVLFDSHLENSVFTKLYLESGYNATRFTFAHSEPGISVWGVNEYPNATAVGTTPTSNNTTT
ncbi:STT3 domain-containing protein [Methanosphaera sp.]|uniref:STT3 domain-containing protein n=1 Tax=Methanosphaera sp. TaxID=2666342 RepID=UPI002E77886B|nr:STT3 domain-containing protein [Methanosphaera sp.]MEE1117236.1 STT3 domain-containing protein [Methanosphaera sp.]